MITVHTCTETVYADRIGARFPSIWHIAAVIAASTECQTNPPYGSAAAARQIAGKRAPKLTEGPGLISVRQSGRLL
ncbi:hypothetical protein SAMN03159495_4377 [Pseudomonas sp. NFR16]|nr:hypothetical protein SAMN03159495_4377 [Pseudomonas sp. NFR16]